MSGEYIQSKTIEDYWNQLKLIYKQKSDDWKDIDSEEYNRIEKSEREDSDNHLNEERLSKDTEVIDICHYKYLPDRWMAFHIKVIDKNQKSVDNYFKIRIKEGMSLN